MNIVERTQIFVGWVRPQAVTHRSNSFRSRSERMLTTGGLRLRLTRPTLALVFFCAGLAQAAPITLKDDAGHTLTLPGPAKRVISLAPSLTEMLFEAGGGGTLVGAVEYSDYPPAALQVPRIGSNQKLDVERIAQLKPDLVLVWFHGNAQREVERLAALKIPMFFIEPHGIGDIPGAIERIGQLVGSQPTARAAATRFKARHAALQARYAGKSPVRVFYQVSAKPLYTINGSQIISDVIRLCGGVNVFGKEAMLVPQLSTESVVAANPDAILTARMGGGGEGPLRVMDEASLAGWLKFTSLPAVKNKQLWLIPGDAISRHGPRILNGAQAVCTALDEARKFK